MKLTDGRAIWFARFVGGNLVKAMIMAIAALAHPQGSGRFDLQCAGTMTVIGGAATPYEAHYRLDLDAMVWCESRCNSRHSIVAAQPTSLTLEDEQVPDLGHSLHQIDRETGADLIFIDGAMPTKWVGQCQRLPFSGFPTFETKF